MRVASYDPHTDHRVKGQESKNNRFNPCLHTDHRVEDREKKTKRERIFSLFYVTRIASYDVHTHKHLHTKEKERRENQSKSVAQERTKEIELFMCLVSSARTPRKEYKRERRLRGKSSISLEIDLLSLTSLWENSKVLKLLGTIFFRVDLRKSWSFSQGRPRGN